MNLKFLLLTAMLSNLAVFAQNDLRNTKTRKLLQTHQPLSIKAEDKTIVLNNYNYQEFGEQYIIENDLESSKEVEFSIVKRDEEVTGFIYYPNQPFGYLVSTLNGIVSYKKTPSKEILFTCSFSEEEHEFNNQSVTHESVYPDTYFIGNYATETNVLKLQSKPGAKYLLYLDFDGEPYLKGWENQGFVATEVTNMPIGLKQRIWEAVAADFIPFDVNVTMDRAVFDAHQTINKGWAVCADFGSPGWYGVAFRPSFGTGKPALIDLPTSWDKNYNYLFRTPSHELGHSLSLSHDGNNINGDGEYYKGHGEYTPIMGSGTRLVTHWSKGEYSGATNFEDDLFEIERYLGSAIDDYAGVRSLVFSADQINSVDNHGVIDNNNDEDVWKFNMTGTGDVNITIDPVLALTDLDVKLVVKNEWGQIVFEDSPVGKRSVNINQSLDLGTYYLHISSASELSVSSGWSKYGVFGYYDIYGSVENVVRVQHDIVANKITGLDNICSKTEVLNPKIEIQNVGVVPITELIFNVYEDDVLVYSIQKSTNILSDDIESFTLNTILNEGSHTYKVVVVDGTGLESKTDNNTQTGNYYYANGEVYEFFTNIPFYNGESGFVWEMNSSTGSLSIPSSSDLSIDKGIYDTQDFCLKNNNCYEITFSGEVDNCTGGSRWNANTVYNSGDKCSYGGFNWEAQWWTQNETPPANVWTKLGSCSSGNYDFGFRNKTTQQDEFLNSTSNYSSPHEESFCLGSITSIKNGELNQTKIRVFPNPVTNYLNITVNGEGEIYIYNLLGELLEKKEINKWAKFNFKTYKSGLYVVCFKHEKGIEVSRVIK